MKSVFALCVMFLCSNFAFAADKSLSCNLLIDGKSSDSVDVTLTSVSPNYEFGNIGGIPGRLFLSPNQNFDGVVIQFDLSGGKQVGTAVTMRRVSDIGILTANADGSDVSIACVRTK